MAGNILNFNSKKLHVRLSDSEFYDFYLAKDEVCLSQYDGIVDDCLIAHYDFNDSNIFQSGNTDTIYSLATWTGATNTGYTIDTIGLTGIDNGLVTFDKPSGDTTNEALLSALTGTTLIIPSGETRLTLNRVTGMTGDYIYPMEQLYDIDIDENYMGFCGGFYQGYYKLDGKSYEVLPNRVEKAWVAEFTIKKTDSICEIGSLTQEDSDLILQEGGSELLLSTGTTLNDLYPDNKGIFFYMGTRAENKFWNQFEGVNTGTTSACTSGATEWCTIPKEFDISVIDDASGFAVPLNPPPIIITEITNQFLIYGRAHSGGTSFCNTVGDGLGRQRACDFTGTSIFVTSTKQVQTDFRNPFLIYNRSKGKSCGPCGTKTSSGATGETACSYSGDSVDMDELDWAADVVDNALAFRVKDDGSIGYRLLTVTATCVDDKTVSGCSIEESYSPSGMVQDNRWTNIAIRFVADTTYDECELETKGPRKGKLMFYVDCKLKHVVDDFDEFIARRLNCEHWKKQVAVPFNISLGGGSQGLLETMTFDGQDQSDLGLCIQDNFAGTFIGGISQFRLHNCDLDWCKLQENCAVDCERYETCTGCKTGVEDDEFLLQEDGDPILQENGGGIVNETQVDFCLQQEDGGTLLQEDGDCIEVEEETLGFMTLEDGDYLLQENNSKLVYNI